MSWKIKKEIIEVTKKERGYSLRKKGGDVSILLIYPNSYPVGINNLGYIGIYEILNRHKGILCERAYIPPDWKSKNFKLFSIESLRPSSEFDVLAFSISFELDFLNVVYILKNENIPLFSEERDDYYPLIIGGGIAVSANPEPLADIFDVLLIGEGEELVQEFSNFLIQKKEQSITKRKFFELIKDLEGVYIPNFARFDYNGVKIEKIESIQKLPIKKRVYLNFSKDPMVSPFISENGVFSNMALCELVRGCKYQCRFCLAGFFYRPYRVSSIDYIYEKLRRFYDHIPKIGLIVPAIDPSINIIDLKNFSKESEILFSFSSLRLEDITLDILELIKESGQKTLTIAPETGSDRLRKVLNKGFSNDDIFAFIENIKEYRIKTLKLYFMIGLPTETQSDIEGICKLVSDIRKINKSMELSVSISNFIPKPHTPFQWEEMKDLHYIKEKQTFLLKKLKEIRNVKIEVEDSFWSIWQGIISRGDRRLNILWKEIYSNKEISSRILKSILKDNNGLFNSYLRLRDEDEIFPWDIIDTGIKKSYLLRERKLAYEEKLTSPCNERCKICGVCV